MPVRYPKIHSGKGRHYPRTSSKGFIGCIDGRPESIGIGDRLIAGWRSTDPTAKRIYDSDSVDRNGH